MARSVVDDAFLGSSIDEDAYQAGFRAAARLGLDTYRGELARRILSFAKGAAAGFISSSSWVSPMAAVEWRFELVDLKADEQDPLSTTEG